MHTNVSPSSSRMLASYLTDIEQLLDEQHGDVALREASDLPRIAVALTDPQLRYTGEQLQTWCQQWVGPPGDPAEAHELDYERVGRNLREQLSHDPAPAPAVPTRALRRLQLRRHVRNPPRGFSAPHGATQTAKDAETHEMCTALVEAARRWYARSACHDSTVQSNLARLAVLR